MAHPPVKFCVRIVELLWHSAPVRLGQIAWISSANPTLYYGLFGLKRHWTTTQCSSDCSTLSLHYFQSRQCLPKALTCEISPRQIESPQVGQVSLCMTTGERT